MYDIRSSTLEVCCLVLQSSMILLMTQLSASLNLSREYLCIPGHKQAFDLF